MFLFEVKKPGKKIKNILAELGSSYEIKVIDAEQCIYRNLHNGYDIEVSGLNNQKQSFKASIYVWETSPNLQIVEKIMDINSLDKLRVKLGELSVKYSKRNQ